MRSAHQPATTCKRRARSACFSYAPQRTRRTSVPRSAGGLRLPKIEQSVPDQGLGAEGALATVAFRKGPGGQLHRM
jgi:hypothetical protein